MNGKPGFALSVPANLSGVLRVAEGGSAQWSVIEGPSAVVNSQVAFAPVHGALSLAAGQTAVFAMYGGVLSQISAASGTVVDFASNTPLAGVNVAIAAYTANAPATQVATTSAGGKFSFTAAPGTYYLIIGSDLATDGTTTLHKQIILNAGANALALPIPITQANIVLSPSQLSGNFRLTKQTQQEQSCIDGANQGRIGKLRPFIADEFLVEHAVAMNQEEFAQNTDTPSPLFYDPTAKFFFSLGLPENQNTADGAGGETTLGGAVGPFPDYTPAAGEVPPDWDPTYDGVDFQACSNWTGLTYSYTLGNPPYPMSTNPINIYYGGDEQPFLTATTQGQFGDQSWYGDPRPIPSNQPIPVSTFTPVTIPVPVATPTPGPIVLTVSAGTDTGLNYPISEEPASTIDDAFAVLGSVAPATSQTTTITATESGYRGSFFVMYSPVNCVPTTGVNAISIAQTSQTTWLATSTPLPPAGGAYTCEMYVRNANPGTDIGLLSQETSLTIEYAEPTGPQSVTRQAHRIQRVTPTFSTAVRKGSF